MIYGLVEAYCNEKSWLIVPFNCLSKKGEDNLHRANAEILDEMDSDTRAQFLLELNGVVVGEQ